MGYMKSSRFILMDYPDKMTNDVSFIKDLRLDELENNQCYSCTFSVERRGFQQEFQPNGGVWRRMPIFFDHNI